MRRQIFRAPGTWTNPGTVTSIDVIVVGGGGGGATSPYGYGGGGGGYREGTLTIPTSPVPVTVGAGGAGGVDGVSGGAGQVGGTTSFGSPSDPWALIVDGGGAGGSTVATPMPPIGGGGGGGTGPGGLGYPGTPLFGGMGNPFGVNYPTVLYKSPATSPSVIPEHFFHATLNMQTTHPSGRWGFCGGGNSGRDGGGIYAEDPTGSTEFFRWAYDAVPYANPEGRFASPGMANTGGGGAGCKETPPTTAGDGGSGIVILAWEE